MIIQAFVDEVVPSLTPPALSVNVVLVDDVEGKTRKTFYLPLSSATKADLEAAVREYVRNVDAVGTVIKSVTKGMELDLKDPVVVPDEPVKTEAAAVVTRGKAKR